MASLPFSWLVVEEEQVESGVDPVDSSIMPSLGEIMLVVAHFFTRSSTVCDDSHPGSLLQYQCNSGP